MSVDYYLRHIEQEQRDFRKVLERYFHPKRYEHPRVLSICCGVANEESVIGEYFGENTKFVGLDYSKRVEKLRGELGRKPIINADIRNLEKFVKGKFEIIIGRNIPLNPNYDDTCEKVDDHWPASIENLKHHMTQKSLFFLTLAREDEFYRAQEILNEKGIKIKNAEKNPIRVQSDYLGVAGADIKDNYIIIGNLN